MLCSKAGALLKNIINDTIHREIGRIGILSKALSSTPAPAEGIPDKLYKKVEIEVRGNDPAVLKSYSKFAELAANNLGITVRTNKPLTKPIHERLTVLKSVHVHKKHRVQYETRTYYRYIDVAKITGSTANTYLEYIERNLPEGVAMKVTKVEIRQLPESIRTPPNIN